MSYQFNFAALVPYWPDFISGAWVTLQLTVGAVIFGMVIGVLCAIARRSRFVALRSVAGVYVETVRNTPFIVQIFFLFFGMSSVGVRMPIMVAAIFALVVNVGAYTAEIIRAGMDAIPKGQIEAAEALGLSQFQIYRDIILMPAIEKVYPALTSQFVLMMLTTSICSQISAEELTGVANNIQSNTFRSFETYIVIGLFYIGITLMMRFGFWLIGLYAFPRRRVMGGV
ncbi:amino acid ABC transporter permease [Ketogulonicigenium vulgare]|uniref:Amino acid ABC transporter permease protein n=1 Tax=Ketogulonicigenium vulgare (strain WSH-001) TaxID=759362 RepID=F9Y7N7_KETVW|nr:amino acid ABC transporter permease [Ketogulonicigenium vulgare]ADO41479.1 polar amino acid ABC transporter, inner membrane subunit [Ketogulonicigenium vulgare Y25]AEM42333.1 Amino acid ABC transporter permease protein [Ketogulonicigenium vulgare WSH-001]ALJ79959.1 ABC transporter permease [Ketogulonicigenium vulgare]ANW32851.1 ABC transporter permease [Ketogulonicigenium vulgare]AOZ53415.1 polar amino acid ABC transporter inner membrane protein [Ketogulonicigenium vulgare]